MEGARHEKPEAAALRKIASQEIVLVPQVRNGEAGVFLGREFYNAAKLKEIVDTACTVTRSLTEAHVLACVRMRRALKTVNFLDECLGCTEDKEYTKVAHPSESAAVYLLRANNHQIPDREELGVLVA